MTDDIEIHVVGAAIVSDGRCLVARRGPEMSLPGCWEFPGGKVEGSETPRQALAREIEEELAITVDVGVFLGASRDTERALRLEVFACRILSGEIVLREHDAMRWLPPDELEDLGWAPVDIPIVGAVERYLRSQPEGAASETSDD